MGSSTAATPAVLGAGLVVFSEAALAALDITGMTLGTSVYVSSTDQYFALKVSAATLAAGSVVAVNGVAGLRWHVGGDASPSFIISDAATTTAPDAVVQTHLSSGTPAAGFGLTDAVVLQNAFGASVRAVTDVVSWVVATNGAEQAKRVFSAILAGALTPQMAQNTGNGTPLEIMTCDGTTANAINLSKAGDQRIGKTGSGDMYFTAGTNQSINLYTNGSPAFHSKNGMIQFFGAGTEVAQQTSGANLTNSVTTGGTNDTIADFADLTTYSNSAATIRNDIFQLARKLKQINDGLRALGLFT